MSRKLDYAGFNINDCKVRLAQTKDANDLAIVARTIWSGRDYLPGVLKQWTKEPWFLVCEYNKRVVACIKLTLLPDNSLWFEGLRVLKHLQGYGIGRLMNNAAMEYAIKIAQEQPGIRFEFSTHFLNQETLHLAEKMEFKQVEGFYVMEKYGGKILKMPQEITQPGMDIFDLYPNYLPVGWRAIRKSDEGLEYVSKKAKIFATPRCRYLLGGHQGSDVTILDPIVPNMKEEMPYIQYHVGYKLSLSLIFPRVQASVFSSLESQKFRFGDPNQELLPQMLVFSKSL